MGAKKMAEILKCFPKLEHLDLRGNSINDVKFAEFSHVIAQIPLKTLDLSAS